MSPRDARAVIESLRGVPGWFWPAAGYVFALIDEIQKRHGVTGNLFEIGAHQGRSAILLGKMADPSRETLGVCDPFGREDHAGGNGRAADGPTPLETAFRRNFREGVGRDDFLRVFTAPSARLSTAETTEDCRFFHIDGGHDAEDVYGDLRLASRAVSADGVVVLDDLYNFAWPGVAEGFFRFMRDEPGQFRPLLIGFNKAILARPAAAGSYLTELRNPATCWRAIPRGPYSLGTAELCGASVLVLHAPSRRSPDPRRTLLTTLHQHRPRTADRLARLLRFHDD